MFYLFLAEGFEEIEALATLDVLRRAEIQVTTVGIGGKEIVGAHGISVIADVTDAEVKPDGSLDGVILPGGMPGTIHLEQSETVQAFLEYADREKKWICAICAAPSILGHKGLLEGRKAVCFPGFEEQLLGARVLASPVVVDEPYITAKGAGVAIQFGLAIVEQLKGPSFAKRLEATMQCIC